MKNKRTIKLTGVYDNAKAGVLYEAYANFNLLLRTARKVGDIETVNFFVLSQLRQAKEHRIIDFVELY